MCVLLDIPPLTLLLWTKYKIPGLILGLCAANERHHYRVTPSLIDWAQTYNQPWMHTHKPLQSLHWLPWYLALKFEIRKLNITRRECGNTNQWFQFESYLIGHGSCIPLFMYHVLHSTTKTEATLSQCRYALWDHAKLRPLYQCNARCWEWFRKLLLLIHDILSCYIKYTKYSFWFCNYIYNCHLILSGRV